MKELVESLERLRASEAGLRQIPALEVAERLGAVGARFADPDSDFISLLNLWRYLGEQRTAMGSSAFRRMCRREYLHYLRIREWQDLHSQLRRVARDIKLRRNESPAEADAMSSCSR